VAEAGGIIVAIDVRAEARTLQAGSAWTTIPRSLAKTFTAVLEPLRNGLGWVVARVPFDIKMTWPERKGFRVRGEIAGFAFRSALRPYADGDHFLLVNRKMQAAAKATAGSKVRIKLEPDLEERLAVMPPELAQAMKGDRRLRKWFDGLNDYTRRLICALASEAKSGEARERKAEQMAEWMLLTLEGELDPPPLLKAAFQRQPLARVGWEAMSATRRRNHLMGIFHYQGAEARERRATQAIEDALAVARKAGR
jgi:uncharacterized protein YdeI (YjbR/CyaY-like superfamily)